MDKLEFRSPLEGIRIIELSDHRGEFAGRLLANLGAQVIKIEPPEGSPSRQIGPFYQDDATSDNSIYWWQYNIGKQSVTLDYKTPEGLALLNKLTGTADVVIESLGPGGLEQTFGGWKTLHERQPGLIVLSLSNFGLDGPWANYRGSDLIFLALGGQMMTAGYPPGDDGTYDTPPIAPQMHQSEHIAGCIGTMDVLAALSWRDKTGRGQHIDLSMHAAANACTENHLSWYIIGKMISARRPQFPELYTGDGKMMQVQIGLFRDEWDRVVAFMDKFGMAEDLLDPKYQDPTIRRQPEVREHIDQVLQIFLATHDAEELFHTAQENGVIWAPIREPHESLDDVQFAGRDNFKAVDHQELGRSISYPHSPWVSEQLPWRTGPRAPQVGEHNDHVYRQTLGLNAAELDALKANGTV
ncbi:CoA transferase [Dehalococcoidia bacterium]|nr:CoA transferase [Dehalococcoidia bacterium]